MNYLSVENISKSFGDHALFENVSFGLNKGEKAALVAKNGFGKSTLLGILKDQTNSDSGSVVFRKDISIGFLDQDHLLNDNNTILEEILSTEDADSKTLKEYNSCISKNIDIPSDVLEQMDERNLWDKEVLIDTICSHLKLPDLGSNIKNLSGGQKKRIALAQVLILNPDILILDEPTNHLDLDMIEWLEDYLKSSKSAILMVTHDRYFLEVVCDIIFELARDTIHRYDGNFSYYLMKKAEREEQLQTTIDKAKNTFRTELDWIRKQPKARGTKQKARIDAFQDIKKVAKQRIDKDELSINVNIERLGTKIIELHRIGKQYPDKNIITDFSYLFKRGEKLGIVGNNGVGKTTFLNLLLEKEELSKGKIVIGETVKIGYYSQKGMNFKEDKKVIEIIKDIAEFIPLEKGKKLSALQFLEKFMFPKDMHYQFVRKLSGGERKRLYLMTILMQNPNFLILDEPTNDLDIFTISVLEDYLKDFPGCVIVVSHDRYFMDKIVDHIFYFKGEGEIQDIIGNYTKYREQLNLDKKKTGKPTEKKVLEPTTISEDKPEEKRKLSYKEKVEFDTLESDIENLENRKTEITEMLSSGTLESEKITEISIELSKVSIQIDEKTDRWIELSEFN
jgi:ATP-binding cassette subfamily F protein uup